MEVGVVGAGRQSQRVEYKGGGEIDIGGGGRLSLGGGGAIADEAVDVRGRGLVRGGGGGPPDCDDVLSGVVNNVDVFACTIASIRSKPPAVAAAAGVLSSSDGGGGNHLTTVLSHYAARWLPDIASSPSGRFLLSPQSPTAMWIITHLLMKV
uniref:Uncharacterized protein n=1 Tax=Oryza sativa subsp. japonica TaxID=39947 RepID=Q6Z426_ORYSJ|nr:hypothetical protein [Oryza sativa Japonica Group]